MGELNRRLAVSLCLILMFEFVKRCANVEAHYFARWAASLIESGGYSDVHVHYPDLVWIYVETDPLFSCFLLCFALNKVISLMKKKTSKLKNSHMPAKQRRAKFIMIRLLW